MLKKENPENIIEWLAAYRRVDFAQRPRTAGDLKELAVTIENNCAATIRFADNMLRQIRHDGEELFSLCSLRQQALALRRTCNALVAGSGRVRRLHFTHHEFKTLWSSYDMVVSSLKHTFFLLDRDLAARIHGAL